MATETVDNVIDKDYHKELLADLDRYVSIANIPKSMIWTSLTRYCSEEEVKHFVYSELRKRDKDIFGVAYYGKPSTDEYSVEEKFSAIAGFYLRNYLDARVMTTKHLVDNPDAAKDPSVLLIPNFSVTREKALFANQLADIQGVILDRYLNQKFTVVYLLDCDSAKLVYGQHLFNHLDSHYAFVEYK